LASFGGRLLVLALSRGEVGKLRFGQLVIGNALLIGLGTLIGGVTVIQTDLPALLSVWG
jgi:hypothetical protein